MIITLTESPLDRLTATDGRIRRDRLLCGVAVRANMRHRTFLIATSVKGGQVRMTLGCWPLMSVEEAWGRAMEVPQECRAGKIPSRAQPKPLPMLREALNSYDEAKGLKASSRKRYDSLFRTHFGDWLERPVDEPGEHRVLRALRGLRFVEGHCLGRGRARRGDGADLADGASRQVRRM